MDSGILWLYICSFIVWSSYRSEAREYNAIYLVGKTVTQSSTYQNNPQHAARMAIDKNKNSFTCTKHEKNPYWSVNLGKVYYVNEVKINNRKNCRCGSRFRNVEVLVDDRLCYTYTGPAQDGEEVAKKCSSPIQGKIVKIMIKGEGMLCMVEVKVYGEKAENSATRPPQGQKYKPVWKLIKGTPKQSLDYNRHHTGSKAVDKHFNTYSCTTASQNYPFWYLSLDKPYFIKDVTMVARSDCCGFRQVAVLVSGALCGKRFMGRAKLGEEVTIICNPPLKGTTVKLQTNKRYTLCFAEIDITGAEAYEGSTPDFEAGDWKVVKGVTKQSTTLPSGNQNVAKNAIDGNVYRISHTNKEPAPYWSIDLGKVYNVKEVKIRNRLPCCEDRFQNILVTVDGQQCNNYRGPGHKGESITITCNQVMKGQNVKLKRTTNGYLSMAEVKVIAADVSSGTSTTQASLTGTNEVKEMSELVGIRTGQSSTYNTDFISNHAADGKLDTCSCTKRELFPFWWVELGKLYVIKVVNIIARKECCGKEIKDVMITVDDKLCAVYKGPASNAERVSQPCETPIEGHQVKLTINATTNRVRLIMAEVQVLGTEGNTKRIRKEIVFNLKAEQKTTILGHSAYNALDRNPETVSCTNKGKDQSWSVKFESKAYLVKGVKILNSRGIKNDHELKKISVLVDEELCAFFNGPALTGQEIIINCNKPLRGREVKLVQHEIGYLCLAEVSVKVEIKDE